MTPDPTSIRRAFPFLSEKDPVAYLDSAATCQMPEAVLAAMHDAAAAKANVNRGVYPLAEKATLAYDDARRTVAGFIGAAPHEIIFTKNATEGVNLVARSFGDTLKAGDRIALTVMEHHSNIVPWQQLAERKGIVLEWIGIDADGQPDLSTLEKILKKGQTKLVAMTGLSNVLGSAPDITKVSTMAHEHGAVTLIDAAQLVAHTKVDVTKIGCDFLVFSGHKLYGPTGVGVLYGKKELLDRMPAFLGGGDMIGTVTRKGFTCAELPRKFEAGSMPVTQILGLAAAIRWMQETGMEKIFAHEDALIAHATAALAAIDGLTILGTQNPQKRKGCVSFTVKGVHPHDLAEVLGRRGVCIRAGHHCTQPLHEHLKIQASARMSVAAYNTKDEIDRSVSEIKAAQKLLTK